MNVEEAVTRGSQMPEGSALVAKRPFSWGAEAMFVALTDDYRVPQEILDAGFEYLVGRDDLIDLQRFLKKKRISKRTAAEFVIHYAVTDSAPAWIDDIPDI